MRLRQASIEAAALQVVAFGLLTSENQQAVRGALERYLNLKFPGRNARDSDEERRMRQARELLAREVQKVYLIQPYGGDGADLVTGALESANPQFAAAARKAVAVEAKQALQRRG